MDYHQQQYWNWPRYPQPPRRSRVPFIVGYTLAAVVLIIGLFGLLMPVHASIGATSLSCGNVFSASPQLAQDSAATSGTIDLSFPDEYQQTLAQGYATAAAPLACARNVHTREAWAWTATGLGVASLAAVVIGSIVIPRRRRRQQTYTWTYPSAW